MLTATSARDPEAPIDGGPVRHDHRTYGAGASPPAAGLGRAQHCRGTVPGCSSTFLNVTATDFIFWWPGGTPHRTSPNSVGNQSITSTATSSRSVNAAAAYTPAGPDPTTATPSSGIPHVRHLSQMPAPGSARRIPFRERLRDDVIRNPCVDQCWQVSVSVRMVAATGTEPSRATRRAAP